MTTHPPSQTTILDKQRSKPSKTKFPPNLGQIPKIATILRRKRKGTKEFTY